MHPVWTLIWLVFLFCGAIKARAADQSESFTTIQQAMQEALADSPTQQIAAARLSSAIGARREALGLLLPRLDLTGSYVFRPEISETIAGVETLIRSGETGSLSARATLVLFDPTAASAARTAGIGLQATELESLEMRRQLALETCRAYIALYTAQSLEQAAHTRLDSAKLASEQAQLRAESGLISTLEADRLALEAASASADLSQSQTETLVAAAALQILLPDLRPAALTEPASAISVLQAPTEQEKMHPTLQAAQARIAQAEHQVMAPSLQLLPEISVAGNWTLSDRTGLSDQAQDWSVAATARWTLLDGGRRLAQRRQSVAALHELQANQVRTKREISATRAIAQARIAGARSQIEATRIQKRLAKKQWVATQQLFLHGAASSVDLAEALSAAHTAEIAHIRARLLARTAELDWADATGQWPYRQP